MSKGSQSRVRDVRAYKATYEAIFGKKQDVAPALDIPKDTNAEPLQPSLSEMADKHMELVERYRICGGSLEHAAYKQAVRESFEAARPRKDSQSC